MSLLEMALECLYKFLVYRFAHNPPTQSPHDVAANIARIAADRYMREHSN